MNKKKPKPKPPKITDFSRALLEVAQNANVDRERLDDLEGKVNAICQHLNLKLTPIIESPEPADVQ